MSHRNTQTIIGAVATAFAVACAQHGSAQTASQPAQVPSSEKEARATASALDSLVAKGWDYALEGRFAEAQKQFREALSVDPFCDLAKTSLEPIDAVISRTIGTDTAIHIAKGLKYCDKGMFEKAIVEFKAASAADSKYPWIYVHLGQCYIARGMLDQGITEIKKAIQYDPDYAPGHNNLGAAYIGKGMINEGVSEYKTAISIDPKDAMAHCNLAFNLGERLKLWNDAIAEFKKAIAINPKYAVAHLGLGIAYGEGKRGLEREIAEYKRALELDPSLAQAHKNLAYAYYDKRQDGLAKKHCQMAVKLGANVDPRFKQAIGLP